MGNEIKNISVKNLKVHKMHKKFFPDMEDKQFDLLKADVKERGIQTPLHITKDKQVVCGSVRLRIATQLHMKTVPCIIKDYPDEQAIILDGVADNVKRRQLSKSQLVQLIREIEATLDHVKPGRPTKKGKGKKYEGEKKDKGSKAKRIGKAIGKDASTVTRTKQAFETPKAVQKKIDSGDIPVSLGQKISKLDKAGQGKVSELCEKHKGEALRKKIKKLLKSTATKADAMKELKAFRGQFSKLAADVAASEMKARWDELPRAQRLEFVASFRAVQKLVKELHVALEKEGE